MTTTGDVYDKLAGRLRAEGHPHFIKILQSEVTPEQAELLGELPTWKEGVPVLELPDRKTCKELAAKLNMDENVLYTKLEDLVKKGWIRATKDGYSIPPDVRSMPRGVLPGISETEVSSMWRTFFRSGEYQHVLVDVWEKAKRVNGVSSHKVIPARKALAASPNIDQNQILWYEDMGQLLKKTKKITQLFEACGCKKTNGVEGVICSPWGCTGWEWDQSAIDELQIPPRYGRRAPPPRATRREISWEEMMAANDEMEDAGLVHISPNTAQIDSTCNCCECCCMVLHSLKNVSNVWEVLAPSRYRAVIDVERCAGCQDCVERCHFDAIEMKKPANSKKMKAYIINEHCMGCGLCVFKCPENAMSLELVRPPEHIPTMSVNKLFNIIRTGSE